MISGNLNDVSSAAAQSAMNLLHTGLGAGGLHDDLGNHVVSGNILAILNDIVTDNIGISHNADSAQMSGELSLTNVSSVVASDVLDGASADGGVVVVSTQVVGGLVQNGGQDLQISVPGEVVDGSGSQMHTDLVVGGIVLIDLDVGLHALSVVEVQAVSVVSLGMHDLQVNNSCLLNIVRGSQVVAVHSAGEEQLGALIGLSQSQVEGVTNNGSADGSQLFGHHGVQALGGILVAIGAADAGAVGVGVSVGNAGSGHIDGDFLVAQSGDDLNVTELLTDITPVSDPAVLGAGSILAVEVMTSVTDLPVGLDPVDLVSDVLRNILLTDGTGQDGVDTGGGVIVDVSSGDHQGSPLSLGQLIPAPNLAGLAVNSLEVDSATDTALHVGLHAGGGAGSSNSGVSHDVASGIVVVMDVSEQNFNFLNLVAGGTGDLSQAVLGQSGGLDQLGVSVVPGVLAGLHFELPSSAAESALELLGAAGLAVDVRSQVDPLTLSSLLVQLGDLLAIHLIGAVLALQASSLAGLSAGRCFSAHLNQGVLTSGSNPRFSESLAALVALIGGETHIAAGGVGDLHDGVAAIFQGMLTLARAVAGCEHGGGQHRDNHQHSQEHCKNLLSHNDFPSLLNVFFVALPPMPGSTSDSLAGSLRTVYNS